MEDKLTRTEKIIGKNDERKHKTNKNRKQG